MKKATLPLSAMCLLTVLLSVPAQAQEPVVPSKIEVGIQFSSLTINLPSTAFGAATVNRDYSEAGFGGRFTFNLNRNIALEAEGNFFPHENFSEPASSGRLLQGQFGIKAGKRFGSFGIFAKGRPGFASFSKALTQVGTITIDVNGVPTPFPVFGSRRKTHFSMDLGGVLEFYPSQKILTRIDIGDTIIHYGAGSFFPFGLSVTSDSRTSHNLQISAGIGLRFGSVQPEQPRSQVRQKNERRFEVGAQFSSFGLTQHEHFFGFPPFVPPSDFRDTINLAGFGGRITYNITPNFALEVQGDFYPKDNFFVNNARAGGRLLQGQGGVKAGKRFESFGIFAKARPGVVSFSKSLAINDLDPTFGFPIFSQERKNYFSMDIGGVLEFYPSRRIVARFDGGDTMIHYRSSEMPVIIFPAAQTFLTPAETTHNFQFSAGVGYQF